MGEDEIVRLFNAKIKLERKQYKKRVLQLAPERIYQRRIRSTAGRILQRLCWKRAVR